MKILIVLCIVSAMSCSAFGVPQENHALVVRSRRDLMEQSVKLVEDLVSNLEKAAQEAMNAVSNFTAGVVHEAQEVRDKIVEDIKKFRNRVTVAIEKVFERFSNTSTAVKECVDSNRAQASTVFNETMAHTMVCVDERIADVGQLIQQLKTLANNATADAAAAVQSMKKCTQEGTNLFNTGSCLAMLAVQTELKSVSFLTQSTVLIGRINLAITTLPASLEVCAGTRLIQTGIQTGKIIMDIGTCSANAIFSTITGKV